MLKILLEISYIAVLSLKLSVMCVYIYLTRQRN